AQQFEGAVGDLTDFVLLRLRFVEHGDSGDPHRAVESAGTQAGVEVGARTFDRPVRVSGISVLYESETQKDKVSEIANGTFELLGMDQHLSPEDITVYDQYYGGVYGVPTEAGNDAIRLLARTEGIITDPVYTGKALSGMIDLLQGGHCDGAEAILFFHTGGAPAIFAMAEHFQK
ncbi:MAG: pyridoxal-phosphate dependent enzyme, partial [Bacillota bacterium]